MKFVVITGNGESPAGKTVREAGNCVAEKRHEPG